MSWKDVCAYWDGECHKMMYLNEQFNEFLFDLFHKMLFYQGFANEGIPFYLVMYLQNTKPKFQHNICSIFVFNHLSLWMKVLVFATLDDKTNHILQLFPNRTTFQNIEAELQQKEKCIGVELWLLVNQCLLTN